MGELSGGQKTLVLTGVILGMLLSALDQTVVGTAMPKIIAYLGGINLYSWVFTAYMLTSTAAVLIFGKLSDLYGRRPFYLAGIIIFMLGSSLCGAATSMLALIIFRGLQGLGAGMMMSNSMAIVGDIFPPAERGRWQGVIGAVFGLASIVGPALGGYLTDAISWRWVFYVNLPVGFLALGVLALALPGIQNREVRRSVDYAGVAALVATITPLLLALVWGGSAYAWHAPQILGLVGFSLLMLAVFLLVERRAVEPIIPLDLFANRIFTVTAAAAFLTSIGMFGTTMYMPLFVQGVIGVSATHSGAVLMPMMLSWITASTLSGQLVARWGRYRLLALAGVATMGMGLYLTSLMTATASWMEAARNMVIVGLGLGATMPLYIIAAQNAVPYSQLGVATSVVQFARSVGGTVGVAAMGTILNTSLSRSMSSGVPEALRGALSPAVLKRLADPQFLLNPAALARIQAQLPPGREGFLPLVLKAMRSALAASLHKVFLFSAGMALVALVVSLFLQEIPLRKSNEQKMEKGGSEGEESSLVHSTTW